LFHFPDRLSPFPHTNSFSALRFPPGSRRIACERS
jgi:hypothetical protein